MGAKIFSSRILCAMTFISLLGFVSGVFSEEELFDGDSDAEEEIYINYWKEEEPRKYRDPVVTYTEMFSHADRTKVYSRHVYVKDKNHKRPDGGYFVLYKVDPLDYDETFHDAELIVHRVPSPELVMLWDESIFLLEVQELCQDGPEAELKPTGWLATRRIDVTLESSEGINVSRPVERWLLSPHLHCGFVMRLRNSSGGLVNIGLITPSVGGHWENYVPTLLANVRLTDDYNVENEVGLRKRSLSNGHRKRYLPKNKAQRACRRLDFLIDFPMMSWMAHVIAPTGFNAFYCAGSCTFPVTEAVNITPRALVQNMLHQSQLHEAGQAYDMPSSCCVPTYMNSKTLLIKNPRGRLALRRYEDMIVESCGCR